MFFIATGASYALSEKYYLVFEMARVVHSYWWFASTVYIS